MACLNIKLQAAPDHTASSSEQTTRHHGNVAPLNRSLSMVLKASMRPGRKEAEGEGCRSRECCRQRKSAVSTHPEFSKMCKIGVTLCRHINTGGPL